MHRSDIHVYPIDGPGDVSGLRELIANGDVDPRTVQGVMITHEGDLAGNEFAMLEVAGVLGEHLDRSRSEIVGTVPIQALAGANAYMVPHTAVFTRTSDERAGRSDGEKRFVVAGASTRRFEPHEVGTAAYAREIAATVRSAVEDAEVTSPGDVHLAFAKTPWPDPDRFPATAAARPDFVAEDRWGMLQYAQGAAALGVAMALGEVDEREVDDDRIVTDTAGLYSTVAQCSATEDRDRVAVLVFANSPASDSDMVIGHGVLEHGMDVEGVKGVLRSMGFRFDCCPDAGDRERIRYGWVKPKTSEARELLDHRHTLTTHGTLGPFWWMVEKGPVHSLVASVLGTTVLEVATGREHQGPPGKPLVAVLADA